VLALLLWLGPREQVLADPLEWSSRVWVATLWLVCTAYYLITVDECASREAASPLSVLTMNLARGGGRLAQARCPMKIPLAPLGLDFGLRNAGPIFLARRKRELLSLRLR